MFDHEDRQMTDRSTARREIALVTYDARPDVSDDDRLLADALSARGTVVHAVPWSDPAAGWNSYDAVVVRSCWDYFLRADEFHRWLDRLEAARVPVHNDARILRWNADKSYLRDLAARSVPVIPTHWLDRGSASSLSALRRTTGWSELVVKPTISGGGHRTWRATPEEDPSDDVRLAAMVDDGAVMVQPLVEQIARDGEWSLVFFAGRYSHAVLKRPRSGDFRVQKEHGGTFHAAQPTDAVIAAAERAITAVPVGAEPPLYARVDGCVVDGELLLMELEVLEPELFLRSAPDAAGTLAGALLARLD
jgi:glutathione synthase/RimK-type ligase-like ATP-grasp enzyme